MLLLHGGGGPLSKLPFFESLTKHYDVIAPVHPGFASTPIPQHFDGLEDLVYVYLDFLDALELEDVIVMGSPWGAGWRPKSRCAPAHALGASSWSTRSGSNPAGANLVTLPMPLVFLGLTSLTGYSTIEPTPRI